MAARKNKPERTYEGASPAPIDERLLSPQDLADYLEVPVNTLYTWRHRNTGP